MCGPMFIGVVVMITNIHKTWEEFLAKKDDCIKNYGISSKYYFDTRNGKIIQFDSVWMRLEDIVLSKSDRRKGTDTEWTLSYVGIGIYSKIMKIVKSSRI